MLGTDIERFIESNSRVEITETETGDLFIFNGRPLLVRTDSYLFPTLFFEELVANLPKIVIDMGAIPYICKGADVMAPGILTIKDEFEENDIVLIVDERHGKHLVVGAALFSSENMKKIKRGKTVKNLHYVGDKLWNDIRAT
jgi:PUA domain protein